MDADEAWDEWAHYCWSDDADMEYVEQAFKAGWAAAARENRRQP